MPRSRHNGVWQRFTTNLTASWHGLWLWRSNRECDSSQAKTKPVEQPAVAVAVVPSGGEHRERRLAPNASENRLASGTRAGPTDPGGISSAKDVCWLARRSFHSGWWRYSIALRRGWGLCGDASVTG